MTIDLTSVTPNASNWFSSSVLYEGLGRAEFVEPAGVVEGHTIVRFDSEGNGHVEMAIEAVVPAQSLKYGAMQFFNGEPKWSAKQPVGPATRKIRIRCIKLTVDTAEGKFVSTEIPF